MRNHVQLADAYYRLSDEERKYGESASITNQELLCRGWFLPPNTYDCGSFVVNGTAVVGKESKSLITAANQHKKELIYMKSIFEQTGALTVRRVIILSRTLRCRTNQNIKSASTGVCAAAI